MIDDHIEMPVFPMTESIGSHGPHMHCTAIQYLPQDQPDQMPMLYDKDLINTVLGGSREEVVAMVHNSRIANAQSHTGETLVMKVCRHVMGVEGTQRVWVLAHLLEMGGDTMVCCDAGKNVLHDLFWSAMPPPMEVLQAMEDVITMLHKVTGHKGLLELMLCKDRQGFTPADYIKPEQTNWKSIMDRILTWAKEEDVKRPREEVSEEEEDWMDASVSEEEDWMDASVSEEEKDMKCHDLPLSTNLPSPVSKRPRRGMLLALLCL